MVMTSTKKTKGTYGNGLLWKVKWENPEEFKIKVPHASGIGPSFLDGVPYIMLYITSQRFLHFQK